MSDELKKLQDDVRRLKAQVAALSNVNVGKIIREVETGEPPHLSTAKLQMCKGCKYMRLPHRSNAHYTCNVRHSTIEPTWTCGLYHDKKSPSTLEISTYCGH